jgi:hypothetical protein
LENPFNDLYEAKRRRDYARCGRQISSFTFAEVYLRGCGGASALLSGWKRCSSEKPRGESLRRNI